MSTSYFELLYAIANPRDGGVTWQLAERFDTYARARAECEARAAESVARLRIDKVTRTTMRYAPLAMGEIDQPAHALA